MTIQRIEFVVHAADIDVVDIEQNQAVGTSCNLTQEFPLGDLGVPVGYIARYILEQNAPAENVLHRPHPFNDIRERLFRVRQWQQVVHVAAGNASPAQMIGNPQWLHSRREGLDLRKIV